MVQHDEENRMRHPESISGSESGRNQMFNRSRVEAVLDGARHDAKEKGKTT